MNAPPTHYNCLACGVVLLPEERSGMCQNCISDRDLPSGDDVSSGEIWVPDEMDLDDPW